MELCESAKKGRVCIDLTSAEAIPTTRSVDSTQANMKNLMAGEEVDDDYEEIDPEDD